MRKLKLHSDIPRILKRCIRLWMSIIKDKMILSRINRTTLSSHFDLLTFIWSITMEVIYKENSENLIFAKILEQ